MDIVDLLEMGQFKPKGISFGLVCASAAVIASGLAIVPRYLPAKYEVEGKAACFLIGGILSVAAFKLEKSEAELRNRYDLFVEAQGNIYANRLTAGEIEIEEKISGQFEEIHPPPGHLLEQEKTLIQPMNPDNN